MLGKTTVNRGLVKGVSERDPAEKETTTCRKPFFTEGGVYTGVWVKTRQVRTAIGRKPHVIVSGKRTRGHDQSKGRIGWLGNRHAK